MKRIIKTAMALVFGLTLVYNSDLQNGFVFVNNSSEDGAFIMSETTNTCKIFSSNGGTQSLTAQKCIENFREEFSKGTWGVVAIINPRTNSTPKLER